jgi:hypothetical protein
VGGSLAALLLPSLRTAAGVIVNPFEKGKASKAVLDEDQVKKALVALSRGDYRKAQQTLEKIAESGRADALYYRAYCHVRLLEVEKAQDLLGRLPLHLLGHDEVFRLAVACEEAKLVDWAIKLPEWIASKDPHYRYVVQKVEHLKEQETDKPA